MKLWLEEDIASLFSSPQGFMQMMQLRGEVFRELEGRRTQRVMLKTKAYFIKQHFGVGWKEIFKNLVQGRLPVLSAKNEYVAIKHLESLQIPTMTAVGYGCRGYNPASLQSFLLTQELTQVVSLEDYCRDWRLKPPSFLEKCALIREVARIARRLHESGLNHRDFYLCHFLLALETAGSLQPKLFVIDLHRAQLRRATPKRWQIKDLAGLYFSSLDCGLTARDRLRFIAEYTQTELRDILLQENSIWHKVKQRGDKLYRQHGR